MVNPSSGRPPQATRMLLRAIVDRRAELLSEYTTRLQALNRSPFTIRLYRLAVEKLLATYPQVPFEAMTAEHIERHIYARPISPRSQAQELRYLRCFFKWLTVHQRLMRENPAARAEPPAWQPARRPTFRWRDFEAVCRACRTPEEAVLVRLYYYTGVRLREGLGIRGRDIDLEERTIWITQAKGGRTRQVCFDPPGVPESLRLREPLRGLIANQPPDAHVFPSARSANGARSHEWVNQVLHRLGRGVGLSYPLTAHVLRHGWVWWAKRSGVPLEAARVQLGHQSIRTTDQLYQRLDHQDVRSALDQFLRPPP